MQLIDFKKNYFDLFNIEIGFNIDSAVLHSRQQQLLSQFHPDRFVTANEQQKRLSVQQACHINEAYQTLLDPVSRARYLLEMSGLELNDESETTSDTAFLIEQIEYREQLDACRDHADPVARYEQIDASLKHKAQQLGEAFVSSFAAGDLDTASNVNRKMQFIQRVQAQLAELQLEFEEQYDQ